MAKPSDDFGDEEKTVVDERDIITPVEVPRCSECGRVVFFDDFTDTASAVAFGLFSPDRCVRGHNDRWWWCGERWRLVYVPPR